MKEQAMKEETIKEADVPEVRKEQEELIVFPTDFPIKVMGLNTPEFPTAIGCAVHEILPAFQPENVQIDHYSKTRKYVALNVTVHVISRAQLDSIYVMLTSHPMVKTVL